MSNVIYSEMYLGSEDQPERNVRGINQDGLKYRNWSKRFWNTRKNVRLRSAAFQQAAQECDDQSLTVTAIITRKMYHSDIVQ